MAEGVFKIVVACKPEGRPLVNCNKQVWRSRPYSVCDGFREEMVVAVPSLFRIERYKKEIIAIQIVYDILGIQQIHDFSADVLASQAFRETKDFLIDDVINVQPKEVKDFLFGTAILEGFNTCINTRLTALRLRWPSFRSKSLQVTNRPSGMFP
jgi:hypothetical protein